MSTRRRTENGLPRIGVDRDSALHPDRKLGLIRTVQSDHGREASLWHWGRGRGRPVRQHAARQQLAVARPLPDGDDLSIPDLSRVQVESGFDRLPRLHVLQIFLIVRRQQVAVRIADERGDRPHPVVAGDHTGADLQVDDVAVLRRHQGRVVQVEERLIELGSLGGHASCSRRRSPIRTGVGRAVPPPAPL